MKLGPYRRQRLRLLGLGAVVLGLFAAETGCHRIRRLAGALSDPDGTSTRALEGAGGAPAASLVALAASTASAPPPFSPNIVVDQFGYRPTSEKIAVIRAPQVGFDASHPFTPGPTVALVDAHSNQKLLESAPAPWKDGATDAPSGDKAWWFDFSKITTPGDYFVLDEARGARSATFRIASDVYRDVLVQAVRMFYYQRDGIAKDAKYARAAWVDGVAHPQDAACAAVKGAGPVVDLHGGWFDAGDQNRYTSWGASDAIVLLRAYVENPAAFADDTQIPESGNGVADLLDEVKWELDWIGRMQQPDGSLLSIAGHAGASPPSSDASPCKYGPATSAASLTSAAAFAYGSIVFAAAKGAAVAYPGYAADLATRAQRAWAWADANPSVTFFNTQNGIGGGEQEVDDAGRKQKKVQAAVFLFELTGGAPYRSFFEANYEPLGYAFDPFHLEALDTVLEYSRSSNATPSLRKAIMDRYKGFIENQYYFGVQASNTDAYLAFLPVYTWASNQAKADQGNMFGDVPAFGLDDAASAKALRYAERYVHYIDGVNPLALVYLSNMGDYGAEASVTRFFHSWFAHGSKWDAIGVSPSGPPPGYLTGGPNPSYAWDGCCPSNCAGTTCGTAPPAPPAGQPPEKSYRDFNENWPLDSWSVSEPDDTYQAHYVRLLSKFVP